MAVGTRKNGIMNDMYLNDEMVTVAKSLLLKEDVTNIAKICDLKESTIANVIAGRVKTKCNVIDAIQKIVKMRHYQQQDTIRKNEELIREQC